jgi:hypothetical protein
MFAIVIFGNDHTDLHGNLFISAFGQDIDGSDARV